MYWPLEFVVPSGAVTPFVLPSETVAPWSAVPLWFLSVTLIEPVWIARVVFVVLPLVTLTPVCWTRVPAYVVLTV